MRAIIEEREPTAATEHASSDGFRIKRRSKQARKTVDDDAWAVLLPSTNNQRTCGYAGRPQRWSTSASASTSTSSRASTAKTGHCPSVADVHTGGGVVLQSEHRTGRVALQVSRRARSVIQQVHHRHHHAKLPGECRTLRGLWCVLPCSPLYGRRRRCCCCW